MINLPLDYWHLELTTKCTIKCSRCTRTEQAGAYQVGELSFDTIKRIFTPTIIRNKLMKITFCGGQGDPIYHSKFFDIYRYFKTHNPHCILVTVTNGSYRNKTWWQRFRSLVTPSDEIIFSIDGYDEESNNKYRVNSNWESIMDGIAIMRGGPATLTWSTIIFRYNQRHLGDIVSLARARGVDKFHFVESNLFGKNIKKYIDPILKYDPLEPDRDYVSKYFRSRKHNIEFRNKKDLRYRKYGIGTLRFNVGRARRFKKLLKETKNWPIIPSCMISYFGVYIDAEGIFYPCSWTSHPTVRKSVATGRILKHKDSLWVKYRDVFDINKRSLDEILLDPIWEKLKSGWRNPDRTFIECEKKCSRNFYTKQWQENILKFLGSKHLGKLSMLDNNNNLLTKIMNAET